MKRTYSRAIFIRRVALGRGRRAFTLFEVLLAIALSTVLLALIGTAINLYLTRIEARRTDVEFAQLARSIIAMIGDDLRAGSEYKPQSMAGAMGAAGSASGAISALGSSGATSSGGSGSGTGSGGTGGTGKTITAGSSGTSSSGTSGTSSSSTTSSTSQTTTSSTGTIEGANMTTTPGIYGTLNEIYVDASRPPRLDQLLKSYAGYTNLNVPPEAALGNSVDDMPRTAAGQSTRRAQSDLKTVHYILRQGQEVADPTSIVVTSLVPVAQKDEQSMIGGLIRQEIDRAQRLAAETIGDPTAMEVGQKIIAPEVIGIEFHYFDGTQVLESWDTKVNGGLPPAIEVRLWLADPNEVHSAEASGGGILASRMAAREFRQWIYLPQAKPLSTTSTTGTTSSTGTSTTGGTTTGTN